MRRLTPDDARLMALVAAAGGSVCPGTDATISREAHKLLRRLASWLDGGGEVTDLDFSYFSALLAGWAEQQKRVIAP